MQAPMRKGSKAYIDHYKAVFADYLIACVDEEREEYEVICPGHETPGKSRPSGRINFKQGIWHCFSSCDPKRGDNFLDSLERIMLQRTGGERATVTDIKTRKPVPVKSKADAVPVMSDWDVSEFLVRLVTNPRRMQELLERRGITEETVCQYSIGWWAEKRSYTVPLYNRDGVLVNVRMLRLDPPENGWKAKWQATQTELPLFFSNVFTSNESVLIVEGEWDALLARQMGFNATTASHGAKGWQASDNDLLEGMDVTLMYDNDKPGREGMEKAAHAIKRSGLVRSLSVAKHDIPGADFTDLVVKHKWSRGDFRVLLDSAAPVPIDAKGDPGTADAPAEGKPVPFGRLSSRNSATEVVESTATVSARMDHYRLPWRGFLNCAEDAGESKCQGCPMSSGTPGEMAFELDRTDLDVYLPMVSNEAEKIRRHVGKLMGLKCTKFQITDEKEIDVERLLLSPPPTDKRSTDLGNDNMVDAYVIGSYDSRPGDTLKFVGKAGADAKTAGAVFMAWHKEDNNPLRYRKELAQKEHDLLMSLFVPDDVDPYEHALSIASDVAQHYGIVGRDNLMLAFMLTGASVLSFPFRGDIKHGWMQGFIVGDTRTGKSMVAERYLDHIGYGSMIKCDVSTRAGLVGGAAKFRGAQYTKMGAIPRCDRQMAVLDEVTNILDDGEVMRQLTDMRSSGRIELNMISEGSFDARVRQVWMSNPPRNCSLSDFGLHGVQAIAELVGTPQDLARFDFIGAVKQDPGIARKINSNDRRKKTIYTADAFRLLTEWAWTRQPSDIAITKDVEDFIGSVANEVGEKYRNNRFMVIPGSEASIKIARIATAFAVLTFSTDNGSNVNVTRGHVLAAQQFLESLFDDEALGLGQYVVEERDTNELADSSIDWFWKQAKDGREDYQAFARMCNAGSFRSRDLRTWGVTDDTTFLTQMTEHGLLTQATGDGFLVATALRESIAEHVKAERAQRRKDASGNAG